MRNHARTGRALRVGFFGILGSGNWGNDGSLHVAVTELRSRFPELELHFMAMGPDVTTTRYGAPSVHLQWYESTLGRAHPVPAGIRKVLGRLVDPIRTWRWVRSLDVAIVPGAGVFETTTPVRPWAQPWSLLALSLAGRLAGTPVVYLCVGANVPGQWLIRTQHRWAARLAHYRSYRDELSREAMRAIGVDVSADAVFPDLAFGLPGDGGVSPTSEAIGVGLMNYRGGNDARKGAEQLHERYLQAMTALVADLVRDGRDVRLFTGDREDDDIVDLVLAALPTEGAGGSARAEPVATLPELLEAMRHVRLFVGSRYHNVLGALVVGVPTLSVSYAEKSDVLMASVGMEAYCHPASAIDVARLQRQLADLERSQDQVRHGLRAAARASRAEVDRQFDALGQLLAAVSRDVGTGSEVATGGEIGAQP